MKRKLLTSDDFSSIEDISQSISNIDYDDRDNYLSIKISPISLIYQKKSPESIICNKNRFIIIDDDVGIYNCFKSKNKAIYRRPSQDFNLEFYLEDVELDEMDESSVNILKLILC